MVASLERHLEKERKIVFETILGQKCFPIGLAYPHDADNETLKINIQCVKDADFVVLLIGTEYGPLSDQGVGFIHSTYSAAKTARKPVVCLIYDGEYATDSDTFDRKRLEGLIDLLKNCSVYHWHDRESLRKSVERALRHIRKNYTTVGWVKGDKGAHEQGEQEILKELKSQAVQSQESTPKKEKNGSAGQDPMAGAGELWTLHYECNAYREGRLKQHRGTILFPPAETFSWFVSSLQSPVTETKLRSIIADKLHDSVLADAQFNWDGCHAVSDIKLTSESFFELKSNLLELDLIAIDSKGKWKITQTGEQAAKRRAR